MYALLAASVILSEGAPSYRFLVRSCGWPNLSYLSDGLQAVLEDSMERHAMPRTTRDAMI